MGDLNPRLFRDTEPPSDFAPLEAEARILLTSFEYSRIGRTKMLSFGRIGPYVGRQQQITVNPS